MADEGAVENLAATAADWFGSTTLVINNAGIGAGGRAVGETPLADWHRTLGVNLWGVIHGCHVFMPAMREARAGGVINVASAAGFTAAPDMAAYNVSKAGVVSLSETLAAELSGTGVGGHGAVPDVRADQHLRRRADRPAAAGLAKRIVQPRRLLPGAGRPR